MTRRVRQIADSAEQCRQDGDAHNDPMDILVGQQIRFEGFLLSGEVSASAEKHQHITGNDEQIESRQCAQGCRFRQAHCQP